MGAVTGSRELGSGMDTGVLGALAGTSALGEGWICLLLTALCFCAPAFLSEQTKLSLRSLALDAASKMI